MKDEFFLWTSVIDSGAAEALLRQLQQIECETIHLLITSPGGSVPVALGLAHFLAALPCRVITYNVSSVDSAAVLLFAAGTERICLAESRFYVHEVAKEIVSSTVSLKTLQREMDELTLDSENIAQMLARVTKLTPEEWKSRMSDGWIIDPPTAVEIGLATTMATIPPIAPGGWHWIDSQCDGHKK